MHRVVVTGYGMVSPLGLNAQESWEAAINGRSGVGPITLFDTTDFPVKIAAEVKNFDPAQFLDRREVRRQDRTQWMAAVVANEAFARSGLEITEANSLRIGTAISTSVGGLGSMIEQIINLHEHGAKKVSPFSIPKSMANGSSGTVSINHNLRGPSFSVASACASGSDGIGMALHLLRSGAVDAMVAGGVEAGVLPFAIASFLQMGVYSARADCTPAPFSKQRDGMVMGEGSAVLVLETLEHAEKRGANIYAELAGYGATADAFHITAPTEDGHGSAAAMRIALRDAGVQPDQVDYINAHGTGTHLNDASETKAIKLVLGEHAYNTAVSSTKSMTGHAIGATGAMEALFCVNAIEHGIIPPTINYTEPDPECDLDYVPNVAQQRTVKVAMTNSFGFGGHNSVLVFKAFEN